RAPLVSSTSDPGAAPQPVVQAERSASTHRRRTYQGSAAMKLGVSATLLLACLTVAPVTFAQEPAPRGSGDSPAILDRTPSSTDSAPAATADATGAGAPAPAPAAPSDTPPNLPIVAAPTPTPVPTPLDLASAYQIGPEDVLEISVWKNPE